MTDLIALGLAPSSPVLDKPACAEINDFVADDLAAASPELDTPAAPITSVQSYSSVIRDALFAKTVVLPFFQGFIARRSRQLPVQQYHVPYLGVYILGEEMGPDGDANAGEIRFVHHLRVGFQVMIENNDPVQAELTLDAAFWAIMNGLWRDANLTNFIESDMPDNTRIESIERGMRSHKWGAVGVNGEKPWGELEYVATVCYRAEYAPIITDDLLHIHEEVVPLADDGTVPDASEVQRIIVEYEFTPAKGVEHDHRNRGTQKAHRRPTSGARGAHAQSNVGARRADERRPAPSAETPARNQIPRERLGRMAERPFHKTPHR